MEVSDNLDMKMPNTLATINRTEKRKYMEIR